MPTTINKQRLFNLLFATETKTRPAEEEPRPVLEQFLYALCREGVTRDQADRAFRNLRELFFDWNEVRVSSVRELAEAMQGLPNPEQRAQRLIDFLQEVFETTFSFDLETLHKKGVKVAAKQLARYQAANDYAVAWVIQQSLGGHAIPLDSPTLRPLRRWGFWRPKSKIPKPCAPVLNIRLPRPRPVVQRSHERTGRGLLLRGRSLLWSLPAGQRLPVRR